MPEPLSLSGDGTLWRMSVETYHNLIEKGAFGPDEDVELIHGYVVNKMPKNPIHAKVNQWLLIHFSQLISLNQGWYIAVQDPITLPDSEPEPDLAVIRGTPDDHEGHPGPQDVGLVVEVSDSSLDFDEGVKMRMYAANNIVEYWIVNVIEKQIQVYSEPYQQGEQTGYRRLNKFIIGDAVPLNLDGRNFGQIPVADILS